jgi:transposase
VRPGAVTDTKEYKLKTPQGVEYTAQLSDAEAKKLGLKAAKPANKAAKKPANKAAAAKADK